ncbi:hypothetical protein C8J56DRAFT_1004281 [Mycena floridula]|nr:hypothetical protein C8J56DRAFT_1004281 [Mycena floridula]
MNAPNEEGIHAPEGSAAAEPEPAPQQTRLQESNITSALEASTLHDLGADLANKIKNPIQETLTIDDPDHRLSLDLYLALTNASEAAYNLVSAVVRHRYPESDILSYYRVKKLVEDLSGVSTISDDMCINSCVAFTGPWKDLQQCPECNQPWYEEGKPGIPQKRFHTIPIGPQLQAKYHSPESAESMTYRKRCTKQNLAELRANNGPCTSLYHDLFDGSNYITSVIDGNILENDVVLVMSLDGTQLYQMKRSDTWIYIWIVMDQSPELRYQKKNVLVGAVIPGPNKPKSLDSFLFSKGLVVWNAAYCSKNPDAPSAAGLFTLYPFLMLISADEPGMAAAAGMTGHFGKHECRFMCPLPSRRPPESTHYYPACFKPVDYDVEGSNHDDVLLHPLLAGFTSSTSRTRYLQNLNLLIASHNNTQYQDRRLETGIVKPTIFEGLPQHHMFPVPTCFPGDAMHLPCLNMTALFLPLWRGSQKECMETDTVDSWDWAVLRKPEAWQAHGKTVADATPYLPGSFDKAPRNPAEKISSGYKAWEFLIYFFVLGPAVFYNVLPDIYWCHYCKAVQAIWLQLQEEITQDDVVAADSLLTTFSDDFEHLYVQRRAYRIHLVRHSIHSPSHFPPETTHIGPPLIYSQWTMERTIGNLGEEIKQHSDPYSNLAQRALRRCQVNAIKAMIPDIEPDLGGGYILLPKQDTVLRVMDACEATALDIYLCETQGINNTVHEVHKWARLKLPNGQVARSLWCEKGRVLTKLRISHNVKILLNGQIEFAEVWYYAILKIGESRKAVAVLSLYSRPHPGLLQASSGMYWTMQHLRDTGVIVADVTTIQACVAVIPDLQYGKVHHDSTEKDCWYLGERPGLKLAGMIGLVDPEAEPDVIV